MNMTLMMLAEKVLKGTEKLSGIEITSMTVVGLGVVFGALLILVCFLYLSGGIFKRMGAQKKNAPAAPAAPAKVKAAPVKAIAAAPAASTGDEDEIIAVITAAIAAMSAADGKAYRLHSVKPVSRGGNGRSAWAQAGIHDATRPF